MNPNKNINKTDVHGSPPPFESTRAQNLAQITRQTPTARLFLGQLHNQPPAVHGGQLPPGEVGSHLQERTQRNTKQNRTTSAQIQRQHALRPSALIQNKESDMFEVDLLIPFQN